MQRTLVAAALSVLLGAPLAPAAEQFGKANEPLPPGFTSVRYAGGAVRFACGPEWSAGELIDGRNVLLVFTLEPMPQRATDLVDGFWINYQYTGDQNTDAAEETSAGKVAARISARLAQVTRRRAILKSSRKLDIGGFAGRLQEFTLAAGTWTRDQTGGQFRLAGAASHRGLHAQVRTPRGWFELHMVAPTPAYAARAQTVQGLLRSLELQDPDLPRARLVPQLASAAPLIGSWKAVGSQLVLQPDGHVVLHFDRGEHYRLNEQQRLDYEHPTTQLRGSFVAQGDLLRITWTDKSRRNYRWRMDQGRLLLTDHQGRVSQLHRLFP